MPTWLQVFCFTWFDVPGPKDSWDGDGFQPAPLECARGFFHCLPLHIISARLGLTHVWRVPDIDIEEILRMFPFPIPEGFSPLVKDEIGVAQVNLARKGRWIFLWLDILLLFQLKISIQLWGSKYFWRVLWKWLILDDVSRKLLKTVGHSRVCNLGTQCFQSSAWQGQSR